MPFSAATMRIRSANCGWLCRSSTGIEPLRCAQRLFEELLRSNVAIVARSTQQARPVRRRRLLLNTLQHFLAGLRQAVEIVHEVDQQELPAELLWEGWLHPEIEFASTER